MIKKRWNLWKFSFRIVLFNTHGQRMLSTGFAPAFSLPWLVYCRKPELNKRKRHGLGRNLFELGCIGAASKIDIGSSGISVRASLSKEES